MGVGASDVLPGDVPPSEPASRRHTIIPLNNKLHPQFYFTFALNLMPSTSTPFARHHHIRYLLQCVSTPNFTCLAPASDPNRHQTATIVPRCHLPVLHSTRVNVFPNVWDLHQTSKHDRGDMKLLQTTIPTNIRSHCTKFGRPSDLAPGTCAPLVLSILNLHETTQHQSSLESLSLKLPI